MQTRILAALLCGCTLATAAVAETIVVNDEVQVRDSQLQRPKRGLSMDEVEKDVAHRAARLYRFDRRKYQQLQKRGFHFEI